MSWPGHSTSCSGITRAPSIRDGVLYFDPRLPSELGGLSFPMQFRETPILVTLGGAG